MDYLDYLLTNDTIRPTWLTKDKEFTGGYVVPDWVKLLRLGYKTVKDDISQLKKINEKDPSKNNQVPSSNINEPISNIIRYRLTGNIRPGFPRSEWGWNNFSVNPIKGS